LHLEALGLTACIPSGLLVCALPVLPVPLHSAFSASVLSGLGGDA
jgi:hypothetical protein